MANDGSPDDRNGFCREKAARVSKVSAFAFVGGWLAFFAIRLMSPDQTELVMIAFVTANAGFVGFMATNLALRDGQETGVVRWRRLLAGAIFAAVIVAMTTTVTFDL